MALKKADDGVALRAVEKRDYPRGIHGLADQLEDADPAVRRWAARDLAAHPDAAVSVCARLAREADASVRSALFTTALRLGGDAVVEGLVPLLRSEDPGLRNGAIEVLSGLPDAVKPFIGSLLRDEDSDVRIFTVNLLGDLQHPKVGEWLALVLKFDPAINVVCAALEVLAEVGSEESLPALRAVRERFADDAFIAFTVDLVIERIGTP